MISCWRDIYFLRRIAYTPNSNLFIDTRRNIPFFNKVVELLEGHLFFFHDLIGKVIFYNINIQTSGVFPQLQCTYTETATYSAWTIRNPKLTATRVWSLSALCVNFHHLLRLSFLFFDWNTTLPGNGRKKNVSNFQSSQRFIITTILWDYNTLFVNGNVLWWTNIMLSKDKAFNVDIFWLFCGLLSLSLMFGIFLEIGRPSFFLNNLSEIDSS